MSTKRLTNLQKRKQRERSRRNTRVRLIKKYRPLCVARGFIEYAYQQGWDDETADAAGIMQHHFFMKRKRVSKGGWLGIPYETWETKFGSGYQRIRDNLIQSGFLEEDEIRGYRAGSHCTYYRICQELRNDQITPSYRLQSDRLQELYIENKKYWKRMSEVKRQELAIAKIKKACTVLDDDATVKGSKKSFHELVRKGYLTMEQLKTIERLASNAQLLKVKITDAEFSEIAKKRYARKKRSEKSIYDVDAYEQRGREMLEQRHFAIDKYGRFYTSMTGMFRELWDYTYFKMQQLVAVDVKTSHAVCILVLLKDIEINYFGSTGSHEERLAKCQFARQIKMTPSLEGHLCRASDIYPAYPFFEFKKRLPDDPIEKRKIMDALFKKFTKMHIKSIQNVYVKFEHYIYRKFNDTDLTNMAHYFNVENYKIENLMNLSLTHDPNNDLENMNFIENSNMNILHDLNNLNYSEHNFQVIPTSNSLPDIPCNSVPCIPNLSSGVIAPRTAVGVRLQNELYQQIRKNLHACRITQKFRHNSDQATADIPLFRNLFFPGPEEILEYERLLADDLYTLLMNSIGIDQKERDQFKGDFFHFLYRPAFSRFNGKQQVLRADGSWGLEGILAPVRQSMEELVPSILFFLDLIKCRPGTLKRKGTHYKKVSHLILRIESQIMLETCANLWEKNPNIFLTTVHDCIKCLPKDVKKVKAELERTFKKYHVSPNFEVKEHKRPSDVNG